MGRKVRERHRRIPRSQFVVKDDVAPLPLQLLHLLLQQPPQWVTLRSSIDHELQKHQRLAHIVQPVPALRQVLHHDLPDRAPQVSPRQRVVADKRHPLRRQQLSAQPQQPIPHRRRHPRVHPMRDDEVERPQRPIHLHQVARQQPDIPQPQPLDPFLPPRNWRRRQVHPHEARARQRTRHRNQVPPLVAPDLQHRQLSTAAGSRPCSHAITAICAGWLLGLTKPP